MRSASLLALLVLLFGFAAVPTASAQRGTQDGEMQRRRERWNRMSEEERRVMQQRFRKLQELTPEQRRQLEERAERLEGIMKSLRETAPDELREEIESLEPERRERRWREHGFERTREMGRHLREKMPPDLRRRLESARPEQRHEMFERFVREDQGRSGRAIRWMGRKLGLAREEVERLEQLSREEQRPEVMGLQRRLIVSRVGEHGLPPGLDAVTWAEMQSMSDEEFLRRMRASSSSGQDRRPRERREHRRREDFSRNRARDGRF